VIRRPVEKVLESTLNDLERDMGLDESPSFAGVTSVKDEIDMLLWNSPKSAHGSIEYGSASAPNGVLVFSALLVLVIGALLWVLLPSSHIPIEICLALPVIWAVAWIAGAPLSRVFILFLHAVPPEHLKLALRLAQLPLMGCRLLLFAWGSSFVFDWIFSHHLDQISHRWVQIIDHALTGVIWAAALSIGVLSLTTLFFVARRLLVQMWQLFLFGKDETPEAEMGRGRNASR
jgi:hypothetical protein